MSKLSTIFSIYTSDKSTRSNFIHKKRRYFYLFKKKKGFQIDVVIFLFDVPTKSARILILHKFTFQWCTKLMNEKKTNAKFE